MSFSKMTWSLEKCRTRVDNSLQAICPASEAFAQEAVEALKAGKVIAVPTDTLYGLACDAWYTIPANELFTQLPFLFLVFLFFSLWKFG